MEPSLSRMVCPACNARYEGGQFCAKDGTPLAKDTGAGKATDMVGQVVADRYRIIKMLGEGGMGQVYEASHININKRFAIKLLRPEIVSNPEAVARFRQEAWSASSIGHDNIIEIDDFATLPSGSVYLAMEFLEGCSLAERMRDGNPISAGEALDVLGQVARGLAAAHDKTIIHRDMKPENIFLAKKGPHTVVKILDFGIAKVSGAESNSLTRTGAIFGTPHYMSPEQALGKPLDHRSDIYSVGVIMYEVFTGRVPFEAESFMGILTKHITVEPKRPTEAAPEREIPGDIEAIILRAMAKEADQRYVSMNDFAADLISAVQGHAPQLLTPSGNRPLVQARPMSREQQAAAGTGKRPIAATMVAPEGGKDTRPSQPVAATLMAGIGSQPVPASDAIPFANPEPEAKGGAKGPKVAVALGVTAVLALGGAAAAFMMFQKGPKVASGVAAPPPPLFAPQPKVDPTPAPPAKPADATSDVIVATTPPHARILKDGVQIGETPEAVKVPAGEVVNVVLRKDGFIDEPVTVDPSKGRKLLVKLDKARGRSRDAATIVHAPKVPVYSTPPGKLPTPPPIVAAKDPAAPVVTPPPVRKPHKPGPAEDPYERLDDKPPPGKKRGGEVLDPY